VKLLITGAAGFIGSNYVHLVLEEHPEDSIVVLDKLTYAGNQANLEDVGDKIQFVQGDIADPSVVDDLVGSADAVVNFAAETHVDRSIEDADAFIRTNVQGTKTLLEAARHRPGCRYLQVSTDEVYGAVLTGHSKETDALDPRSPYSAAKAGGDLLVRSYFVSYGLDAVITRGANTIGSYQYPEKVVPLFVTNALDGQPLPIYGQGVAIRDYLYVRDHCEAIDLVLRHGRSGETYNVGAGHELNTIDVADRVLALLAKPASLKRLVEDRPGHDRRYSVDWSKLRGLGWQPRHSLDETFAKTVGWYQANEPWWRPIKSGDFAAFYQRWYGERLANAVPIAPTVPSPAAAGEGEGEGTLRLAVLGANGQLGRQIPADIRLGHEDLDLANPDLSPLNNTDPDGIILAAAYTDVDGCESNRDYAFAVNAEGPRRIAHWCREHGVWLLYVSTNCVFDGRQAKPYDEDANPSPISVYGASKLAGEEAVRDELDRHFILRSSWLFGPGGSNFVTKILAAAEGRTELQGVVDEIACPTYAPDLGPALVRLAQTGQFGTYHLTNQGACSRLAYMRAILAAADIDKPVAPVPLADFQRPSRPPAQSALANHRAAALGITLRPWQEALAEYVPTLKVPA
jgi:dTDP-glucose 4,6-dehydratase